MSLSTVLAFVLLPLAKRNPDEDKEKIAYLEAELASYKETNKVLATDLTAAGNRAHGYALVLQEERQEERERGILDREQTRYWRQQSDYWQQAYTSLAGQADYWRQAYTSLAGRPYSPEEVAQQRERLQQYQQNAQQLTSQQRGLAQGMLNQPQPDLGWLDCTCVPGRAGALLNARPGEAVRVGPGVPVRVTFRE